MPQTKVFACACPFDGAHAVAIGVVGPGGGGAAFCGLGELAQVVVAVLACGGGEAFEHFVDAFDLASRISGVGAFEGGAPVEAAVVQAQDDVVVQRLCCGCEVALGEACRMGFGHIRCDFGKARWALRVGPDRHVQQEHHALQVCAIGDRLGDVVKAPEFAGAEVLRLPQGWLFRACGQRRAAVVGAVFGTLGFGGGFDA